MEQILKFVDYMGTALSWLLAIILVAIVIWGGNISISINGISEITEKFWAEKPGNLHKGAVKPK